MRRVLQTANFSKQKKRLHRNQISDLDEAIRIILKNPESGEQKKGDLASVFVYKCRLSGQLHLIAYIFDESCITLLSVGSHENFYRDLKR